MLCILLLAAPVLWAQSNEPAANNWVADGDVYAMEKDGNTLYLGGGFNWVGPNTGQLVGADATTGALDATFPKANGPVNAVISDGSGGWFVGGSFTRIGTFARAGLAHIQAAKTVDAAFSTGITGSVNALALVSGSLYVGGAFSQAGSIDRDNLAALDASSGSVLAFNPGVVGPVYALAADAGTLYFGGDFSFVGGQGRLRLAALALPAGTLTGWDPGANGIVRVLAVAGANAYAGGDFTQVGGASGNPLLARNKFAAFSTTTPGATISIGNVSFTLGAVRALVLAGNTLYLGGLATNVSVLGRVAVLDAATALPAVSVANPNGEVRCSLPDGSGGWYLGGTFSTIGGIARSRLAHVTSAGAVDTAFNFTAGSISLNAVNALATDGTYLYAAGDLQSGGNNYVLRLDLATGAWITSWTLRVQGGDVQALAVAGGQLFVGGTYFQINGNTVQAPWDNLAAVDLATGDPNSNISGATGSGAVVRALVVSGSTLFVGGFFANLNGSTRTHLGALDVATGTVAAFDPAPSTQVRALAVGGGALYVGGSFSTISATPRQRLAKFDLPGLSLNAWSPGADNQVNALAVGGSTVYVGGAFATLGGAARISGGALDASTGVPAAFNPGITSSVVLTIALQGTQALFAGQFTNFALQTRGNGLAVDLASGNYLPWDPMANGRIDSFALLGTSMFCGGVFTTLGGLPRGGLGAVNATSGAPLSFVCDNSGGVNAIVAQGANVVAGGTFIGAGGRRQPRLASIDVTTGSVSAWAPLVNGNVHALQLNGTTLYVGGSFTQFDGLSRLHVAAVDTGTMALSTFTPQPDGTVYALEVSGSTVYLGGSFSYLDRSLQDSMAVLDAASSAAISTAALVGQWVYAIVPAPGGGWFVGGSFTTVNGLPRSGLVKLFADGSVDSSFTIEANGSIHGLEVISNRLFLAGTFNLVGGQNRPFLAAIDLSTTSVNAWTPAPSSQVYELASSGNTLYAGGVFNTIAGQTRNSLASFDAITLTLNAWNPSPNNQIFGIAAYGSTVFVSGPFTTIGGQSRTRLAAIDATGAAMSFNPAPDATTSALAVAGSRLYVGGDFLNIAGQSRTRLAAFDASTFALLAFNPGADSTVQAFATTASRLYVVGDFTTLAGQSRGAGGAFDLATSSLLAFDCGAGSGSIYAIAEDSGRVCVGGPFDGAGGFARPNLCAVNASTGSVQSFAPTLDGLVRSLAIEGTSLFAGGSFANVNSQPRRGLCEFTLSTGALTSFDAQLNGDVRDLLATASFVYAAGHFYLAGGAPRGRVARLDRTTGAATAWGPYFDFNVLTLADGGPVIYVGGAFTGTGVPCGGMSKLDTSSATPDASFPIVAGNVACAVSDGAGGWYIAGAFSSVGGLARQGLAHILANNSVDTSFAPAVNAGTISAMLIDNNRLFVGGSFTQINSTNRINLAAIDLNAGAGYGTLLSFAPTANLAVYALATGGGRLFVGGNFNTINSLPRPKLAAFDLTTLALQSWNPSVASPVYSLLVSGSILYAGGEFTTAGGQPHAGLAAFDASTLALQTLNAAFAGTNMRIRAMAISGTTLYCMGSFSLVGSLARENFAAIDVNPVSGTYGQATGLNVRIGSSGTGVAVSGTSLFVAGSSFNGQYIGNLLKLDSVTGALQAFQAQPNGAVQFLAVQSTDLFVAGNFDSIRTSTLRPALVALDTANGNIAAWAPDVKNGASPGQASKILVVGGKLVVGGQFTAIGTVSVSNLALFDLTLAITTPSPLPSVMEGMQLSVTFVAVAGQGSLTWSLSGAPGWLSINPSTGQLSGTPPIGIAPTTVSFFVTVTDQASGIDTRPFQFDVTVIPPVVISTPSPLPSIPDGAPYSGQIIAASGGLPPYTFSLSGQPGWLSINASTGELSGNVPVGLGPTSVNFTVNVAHGGPTSGSKNFVLPIASQQPLTITSTSPLPSIAEGSAVNVVLAANGGATPYAWSLSGAPAWLGINPGSGALTGIAPSGIAPVTITFTAMVTDAASGSAQALLSFNVVPALSVLTTTLPDGFELVAYNATVAATGGFAPYAFALSGAPAWLSIGASSGQLSGTPPTSIAPVTFNFTVIVTDASSAVAMRNLSLNVVLIPTLVITTPSQLSDGEVGNAYSATISASGGIPALVWTLPAGPTWLTINAAGQLSGTPPASAAGIVHFEIRVTDNSPTPQVAIMFFTLNIIPSDSKGEESGKCSSGANSGWFMLLPLVCLVLMAARRKWVLLAVCAAPLAAQSYDSWISAPNLNNGTGAPSAREGHRAVWTGDKLIVWGGNAGGPASNTGGIYNPATDTWESAPSLANGTGSPPGRLDFTATWCGNIMIVCGGVQGGTFYSGGGAYDPATDTWQTRPNLANPPVQINPRVNHSAVWTGSKLIIWGGTQNTGTYYNTGAIYDPGTDTWEASPNLRTGTGAPFARAYHGAVWTGSRMLVFGGYQGGQTGGSYDPSTDTWVSAPNLQAGTGAPSGRTFPTAIWTGSRMLIWGGADLINQYGVLTGGMYDPVAEQWVQCPNLQSGAGAPVGRYRHVAAWTGEKLIIFGGFKTPSGMSQDVYDTGGIYFPALEAWQTTPNLSSGSGSPGQIYDAQGGWTGTALIFWGGGQVGVGDTNHGHIYRELPPPAALTIQTTSLPNAQAGNAYSATLTATGGYPPYTWSIVGGVLPMGIALMSSGQFTGTAVTGSDGLYFLQATATDPTGRTTSAILQLRVGEIPKNESSEEEAGCSTADFSSETRAITLAMLAALAMFRARRRNSAKRQRRN
jgi:hypothetical protein